MLSSMNPLTDDTSRWNFCTTNVDEVQEQIRDTLRRSLHGDVLINVTKKQAR